MPNILWMGRNEGADMPTKTFTDANFQTDVLQADLPVVVEFWAEWCGPSRIIGPRLAGLSDELAETVTIGRLNADENPRVLMEYGVRGIPAIAVFKNSHVIGFQLVTAQTLNLTESAMRSWLKALLG